MWSSEIEDRKGGFLERVSLELKFGEKKNRWIIGERSRENLILRSNKNKTSRDK